MDIDAILDNGGYDVRNSNYNPKTKKGRAEQPYLKSSNMGDVHPFITEGYDVNAHEAFMFNVADYDKYINAGINLNTWETTEDWDRQLAERQSAFSKLGNALAQTVVSEVGLGTLKGLSDLADVIGGAIFSGDNDYSNPVSQWLGQLQEDFKNNVAPIYTTPGVNMDNGGLTDAGWWASNIPSVMSSLTLLIPSTGVTKGLSWLGRGLNAASKGKIGAWGRNAYKALTGAGKAKTVEEAEKLNKVTKWLNDTNTMAAGQRMLETGVNAALMRTMENYQEAHQVYDDMRTQALDKFNNMSDEEYNNFINRNSDMLGDVDVNDKEAVASKLAKDSADRTFAIDYANTIFDVIQLNALRNPIKLLKNMRSNAKITSADVASRSAIGNAAKAATSATTEAAEKAGIASATKNFGKGVGTFLKNSAYTIKAEASEGVEEAVNYIAQEEGMHYGNVALGEDIENGFTSRLGSYMRSPELHDAAFWGLMGGIVFQGLGSGFNRISVAAERAYQQKKKKADDKTGEALNYDNFQELFETSENKRRIADINKRTEDFNTLVTRLDQIEGKDGQPGIDPFNVDKNNNPIQLTTETEKTVARERAISEYITGMTFRAMDNGNFDMLKAYLQDSNVRQALEEATGNEGDGGAFIDSLVHRMDHIAESYSNNLIALSNVARNVNIASESTIPLEYLQIIARDNTAHQMQLEDLNARIATYETSAENKKAVYGNKLDQALNYKDAVQLVVLTKQLAQLRAEHSKISQDKTKQGIGRQIELDRLEKSISIVEDMIKGTEDPYGTDALSRLLYSTIQSNLMNDKDAYIGNLEALVRGDIDAILGEGTSKRFELTDEKLMRVLGADRTSGSYKTLATDIDAAFNGAYGLNKIDTRLGDDYFALATLNLQKAVLNEDIIMNEEGLQKKVNELHNDMIDARKNAIEKAGATIRSLAKTYGRQEMLNHLETGDGITWNNEADKKKFDDALEVLNLTSASNQQLYDDLYYMIKMDKLKEIAQAAANPSGESSAISQNPPTTPQPNTSNNQSSQGQQAGQVQGNTLNGGQTGQSQQGQGKTQTPTISNEETLANIEKADVTSMSYDDLTNNLREIVRIEVQARNAGDNNLANRSNTIFKKLQLERYKRDLANATVPEGAHKLVNTKDHYINYGVVSISWNGNGYDGYNKDGQRIEGGSMTASEFERLTGVKPTKSSTGGQGSNSNVVTIDIPTVNGSRQVQAIEVSRNEIKVGDNIAYMGPEGIAIINHGTITTISGSDIVIKSSDGGEFMLPENRKYFRIQNSSTGSAPARDDNGNIIPDAQREAVKKEIGQTIMNAVKTAKQNGTDATEAINAAVSELNTKYGQDDEYRKEINRMATSWNNRAKRQGLAKDVVDLVLLASSVTERGGKFNFPDDYLAAAKKFANNFLIAANAKKFNGKTVVSFESMLRFANKQMEDPTTAEYIYKSLKAWFESGPEASNYIVIDNMDSSSILQRAAMTNKQLASQRLGGTDVYRVQIDQFLTRNASKAAIDKIQKGDKLNAKVTDDGDIILMVGDVEVGRLPQPEVDKNTGAFKKTNNGWITDVRLNNGTVYSELRKVWEDILLNNTPVNNKINSFIYQIIAANKINADTTSIKDAIEKDADLKNFFDSLKARGIVDNNANSVQLIDGLVSIWNYIDLTSPVPAERQADIQYTLDLWFNKLYDSYTTIANATTIGVDKLSFTVDKISDGDVIQVAANDNEGYDKCTLGNNNDAFANIDTTEIGVIKPGGVGVVQTTTNHQVAQPNGSTGSMWAILPNRGGVPGIVRGHMLKFIDIDKGVNNTPAGRIRQAVADEFERRIKAFVNDENTDEAKFNELIQFIDLVLSDNTNTPLLAPTNGGKFKVKKYQDDKGVRVVISFKKADGTYTNFTINSEQRVYNAENLGYKSIDEIDSFVKDFKTIILGNAMFNADYAFFNSDADITSPLNGLATRDKDGNFIITIPNGTNTPLVETFPSFKHFVMQGGGARWNTKVENGSNFRPRSETNQLRNQVLNVRIEANSSRTVEESVEGSITPESINNGTAIDALLEKRFGKDSPSVRRLKSMGLIPSEITYTTDTLMKGDHKSNIWTSTSKKKIYVNDEFIQLMNDNPDMAIRKLIHEQLHLKLHGKGNRRKELLNRIQEIVDDFKTALDNDSSADPHLREYLFNHINSKEERLEEFLVESLTNRELASYLNSKQVKSPTTKTKQSIFDKILELLAEIFDWKVTQGSIYEKELKVLQGYTTEEINESGPSEKRVKTIETLNGYVEETKSHITFDDNSHTYYVDGEPVDYSVTQYASEVYGRPNIEGDYSHSSAIGRSMDAMYRDFFIYGDEVVNRNYPNLNEARKKQILEDLHRLRTYLDGRFGKGKYTVVTDEFPLAVNARTEDGNKVIAGTMDMLIVDDEGNFHIFDFKAKNHPIDRKINGKEGDDRRNYGAQQNMYREMLETINPAFKGKVKSIQLIWMDTFYPKINEVTYFTDDSGQVTVDGTPIEDYTGFGTPHLKENVEDSIISLEMTDNIEGLQVPEMSPINEPFAEESTNEEIIDEDEDEDLSDFGSSVSERIASPNYTAEMQRIKERALTDGTFMRAPNGNPTNLTERQWLQVRTQNFKDWFGDWENDPTNASKVVDENGEPKVVYHGTSRRLNNNSFKSEFIFTSDNDIIGAGYGFQRKGFSIGINYALSNFAGEDINSFREHIENLIKVLENEIELGENMPFYQEGDLDAKKNLIKELKNAKQEIKSRDIFKEFEFNVFNLFQNVKNPLTIDAKGKHWHSIEFEGTTKNTDELAKIAKDRGYDGLIVKNVIDKGAEVSKNGEYAEIANDYVAFNPDQIKSATGNNGEFSTENDDIYASSVQETTAPSVNQFVESLPLEERVNFNNLLLDGTVSMQCS